MNVLDTLLFTHLTIICVLLSRHYFLGDGNQLFIALLIPVFVFGLLLLLKICTKFKNRLVRQYDQPSTNSKTTVRKENSGPDSKENQPLIDPTSVTIDIKSYGGIDN